MNYLSDLLDLPAEQLNIAEDYLSDLRSCSLEDIQREPTDLSARLNSLNQDLANLCFRSYNSLILSHSSYLSVSSSFSSLDTGLDQFLATSQELATTCRSFEGFLSADLNPTRSKLSDALLHVDSVGEVLDLPRLVRACVVNGNWPEALDLGKRVNQLLALCTGESSSHVMHRVRFQVALELIDLKLRILQSLREKSLKLPGAVRGINLLRRLEDPAFELTRSADLSPLAEEELQLVFLASRWDCLKSQLETFAVLARGTHNTAAEASDERVKYIKRWVEVWRELVGDAVNMYSECFLGGNAKLDHAQLIQSREHLLAFLHHALDELLKMLNTNIPAVQTVSSLSTLLTQLAYCAAAFARFGFDFRIPVAAIVEARMETIVVDKWKQGLTNFLAELSPPLPSSARSPLTPQRSSIKVLESLLLAPDSLSKIALIAPNYQPSDQAPAATHQPAQQLTLTPPLARFLNSIASALNELRLLPATSLYPVLQTTLDEILSKATESFLALIEIHRPDLIEKEEEEPLDREKRLKEEGESRMVCVVAVGLMGRSVLPFCEQGLRVGVFGELGQAESEIVKACKGRCEGVLGSLVGEKKEPRTEDEAQAKADDPPADA